MEDTASLDSGDVQVVKTEDEEISTKALSSTHDPRIPSRKSPRCLPPLPLKPQPKEEKVVSEDDKESEMNSEDEERVMGKDNEMEEEKGRERDKEEVTLDAPQENPRKRKANLALP